MHDDDPRQLDFNSMAAYHAAHLIDAKANPIADLYQIKTAASDALRLRQLTTTSADEEQHAESPNSRRSTQEQPADLAGTMSPALGTLVPAQDDYQPSSTPALAARRTTRSRAKPTASYPPSAEDSIIYPSDDEKPPSTGTSTLAKHCRSAKSPVSRFSPTWDQIIAAKGRTSLFIRKLRRQAKQQDAPDSPEEA